MAMVKGDVIKTNDVKDTMTTYVTESLNTANENKVGYAVFGTKSAMWTDFNNAAKDAMKGTIVSKNIIKIADVIGLIKKAMYQACRLGNITYKQYVVPGYLNAKINPAGYLQTITYFGIFSQPNFDTVTKYFNKAKEKLTESGISIPNVGDIIEAISLVNLIKKLAELHKTSEFMKETTYDRPVNTCYGSCHDDCHGSSRSRR